jgi:hypothetical protein
LFSDDTCRRLTPELRARAVDKGEHTIGSDGAGLRVWTI